jgi:hypothetical protein
MDGTVRTAQDHQPRRDLDPPELAPDNERMVYTSFARGTMTCHQPARR